jgi:hypothetical protein
VSVNVNHVGCGIAFVLREPPVPGDIITASALEDPRENERDGMPMRCRTCGRVVDASELKPEAWG